MNDRDIFVGSAWATDTIQLEMHVNGACILCNVVSGFNYWKRSCQSSSWRFKDILCWLLFGLSVGPVCKYNTVERLHLMHRNRTATTSFEGIESAAISNNRAWKVMVMN